MKIINKYPVLTAVEKLAEDSILLKFRQGNHIGAKTDVFAVRIWGKDISKSIELIKEYHLDDFTVIDDEGTELTFYVGNINESPDWGDWGSFFSLPFEKYEAEFITE